MTCVITPPKASAPHVVLHVLLTLNVSQSATATSGPFSGAASATAFAASSCAWQRAHVLSLKNVFWPIDSICESAARRIASADCAGGSG
jgi:hypothetical protein